MCLIRQIGFRRCNICIHIELIFQRLPLPPVLDVGAVIFAVMMSFEAKACAVVPSAVSLPFLAGVTRTSQQPIKQFPSVFVGSIADRTYSLLKSFRWMKGRRGEEERKASSTDCKMDEQKRNLNPCNIWSLAGVACWLLPSKQHNFSEVFQFAHQWLKKTQ